MLEQQVRTMTFDEWMRRVDAIIEARVGCSSADLPDVCYRDWYDDAIQPRSAAAMAIRMANE